MKKYCDLCTRRPIVAIAEVELQGSIGGGWAYVCHSHYALRLNNTAVRMLGVKNNG